MVVTAAFNYAKDYDEGLAHLANLTKDTIINNNDDALFLAVGDTGTGKSSLLMHFYELYAGYENMSVDNISFNKDSFTKALGKVTAADVPTHHKVLFNDEANISKRDAMSKYNKEMIDLYFSIRELNILHLWANPSLEVIDKVFTEERIRGVFFVTTKDRKRPRVYYFFKKKALIKILQIFGKLSLDVLRRNKDLASYKGHFRAYKKDIWTAYIAKKKERIADKVSTFIENNGTKENLMSMTQLTKKVGISADSFYKYEPEYGFKEGEDYVRSTMGDIKYTESAKTKLLTYFRGKKSRRFKLATDLLDRTGGVAPSNGGIRIG